VRLIRLSTAFVVASERRRRGDSRRVCERFVEPFADAVRSAGILGFQPSREIEQQPLRDLHLGGLIGAAEDRLRPRAITIAQILEDVAGLVHLAPLDERGLTRDGPHRFAQRLRTIQDDKETAIRAQPAALQIGEQVLAHAALGHVGIPRPQRATRSSSSIVSNTFRPERTASSNSSVRTSTSRSTTR
jgi:hypothetical protein